jgi:membrane-bound metal-dependent hydrolase YbcI (DUF457 family)
MNVPLIFTLSVIPDLDILVPFLQHRGPTHSIFLEFAVFIPFLVVYGKAAVPYLLALIQHPLIGDLLVGSPAQIFWPLSNRYFGLGIPIRGQTNVALELTVFSVSMIIMLATRDTGFMFRSDVSNVLLVIPTLTVLLPPIVSFPLSVPVLLILPHLIYALMFLASAAAYLFKLNR